MATIKIDESMGHKTEASDYPRVSPQVAGAYKVLDDHYTDYHGVFQPEAVADALRLYIDNDSRLLGRARGNSGRSYNGFVWEAFLEIIHELLEWDDETEHATRLSSEQLKNWFKHNGMDYKDAMKPVVDAIAARYGKRGESRQEEADSMNAIEKFAKEHGAEYEDEKTLASLFKEAVQSVIGEKGTVGSAWTYTGSNNYGYVDWEASITGVDGMLPEDEIVIVLSTSLDDGVQWLSGRYMDENDTIAEAEHPAGDGQFDPLPIVDRLLAEVKKDRSTTESKKSEDFDMNKAFFQAKKAITDWTKRQGHKTLEWLYTDGRKSPTSYPSGIWDFEWDTGNGMATAELKVSPYETRTNSWNDSMDFSLRAGTEDKPMFYTSVEDVLYALDTLISKNEIKTESKKSEDTSVIHANGENGNVDIYTLDITRINANGNEEGVDDMQGAQTIYGEDEAIRTAKEVADSYKDDGDVVQVTVMAGEQERPNGDIVGDSFDIFTASSSDSATTAKYREKAGYTKTDGLDYYAKGGKSEGNDDDKGCKGKDCKDDKTKKSESLTLKQKELKDMVRTGEAIDITTINDTEAKELRKKGIEVVGVSRGVYGMNGALLRDSDGKKYAITARSSNLFYFV